MCHNLPRSGCLDKFTLRSDHAAFTETAKNPRTTSQALQNSFNMFNVKVNGSRIRKFHRQMLDFAHIRYICMKVACAYVFKIQWYVEDLRSGSLQFEGNSVWLDSPIIFEALMDKKYFIKAATIRQKSK